MVATSDRHMERHHHPGRIRETHTPSPWKWALGCAQPRQMTRKAWAAVVKRPKTRAKAVGQVRVAKGAAKTLVGPPKRSKYGAVRTGKYASKREAARAAELKLLAKAGKIRNLREQVVFELIPVQRNQLTGKVLERAVTWTADFVYEAEQEVVWLVAGAPGPVGMEWGQVVEDAKGMRTQQYVIRRKLMLHVHGIRVREV